MQMLRTFPNAHVVGFTFASDCNNGWRDDSHSLRRALNVVSTMAVRR